jgi:hypothetical protein
MGTNIEDALRQHHEDTALFQSALKHHMRQQEEQSEALKGLLTTMSRALEMLSRKENM